MSDSGGSLAGRTLIMSGGSRVIGLDIALRAAGGQALPIVGDVRSDRLTASEGDLAPDIFLESS